MTLLRVLALWVVASLILGALWAAACGAFDLCDPDDDWTPHR